MIFSPDSPGRGKLIPSIDPAFPNSFKYQVKIRVMDYRT